MPGDTLYLVDSAGVHELPGMPPGNGQSLFPHGAGFISLFGGGAARVYWPSDQALTRARQHAVLMRADASIMECVELRQRAVALLDWRIECERETDREYLQARDLLETICQRIPRFMQYRENLLHAIWFGRYAIANRYRWDWLDGQKLVVVASWIPIHGDKLVWKIDADGGSVLDGIGVRVGGGAGLSEEVKRWRDQHRAQIESTDYGWAYFPPPGMRDLLIVHRHYIEDGEYEEPRNAGKIFGGGIRDRIYWTWYQRQEALAWLMEFLERSAFGIELWYYPAGNPQGREEMKQAAAERVGPGKNILLIPRPPGMEGAAFGVERIEPSMAGAQVLKEILTDFFGHQIKRYILGQTLTTEAHATGLGSNLASIHLDTFLQIVRYDAINLQETLTEQLVRRLVIWNWPHLDATAFRFVIELEKDDTRERLEGIRAAFDMGLKIKAAEIRDLLNLSQPGEDEEFLQNPAYRQSVLGGPPTDQGMTAPGGDVGMESFSQPGRRERYQLPPFPANPSPGQTFRYGKKVYAYLPNKAGRLQWQIIEERKEGQGPERQGGEQAAAGSAEEQTGREGRSSEKGEGKSPEKSPGLEKKRIPEVKFHQARAKAFVQARERMRPEDRVFLSPYSEEELETKVRQGAKIFLSEDGTVGFVMGRNEDGTYDLQNLFRLPEGPKGGGTAGVIHAIASGATTLDCMGPRLAGLYHRCGFKVKRVVAWDDRYAPEGWDYERWGRPPIYFMKYAGESRDPEEIRRRIETGFYGEFIAKNYPEGYEDPNL